MTILEITNQNKLLDMPVREFLAYLRENRIRYCPILLENVKGMLMLTIEKNLIELEVDKCELEDMLIRRMIEE